MAVKSGDTVLVHFVGSLESGEVFDDSERHGKPFEVHTGAHEVIAAFEEALIGMEKGDEKKLTVAPDKGFGERREDLVQTIPRDRMNVGADPRPGMQLMIGLEGMPQFPAQIVAVTDESVTLDLNHPLAGKIVNFSIKVVEIRSAA
jgi:FKBP-type peptidyl-prolyl cis-trans isomerase 2